MDMPHRNRPRFTANSLAWLFLPAVLCMNTGLAANLTPLIGATQVAAGTYFTCAVMNDATAKCWGYNGGGELGDGTTANSNYAATSVAGLSSVSAIAAGEHHACALLAGGTVKCWGNNIYGQIGDGTSGPLAYKTAPTAVSGLANVTMVASGYAHSCALLAAGTVACWGDDTYGQLGNGTSGSYNSIPVAVSGIATAIEISAGDNHNCAVLADRTVKCWGAGGVGQLGNGAALLTSHNIYVTSSYSGAVQLGTGDQFTCALRGDGLAGCWGDNDVYEIGSGATTTPLLTPTAVSGLVSAVAISVHGSHACALVPNGAVQCWGNNGSGQLGDASNINRNGPVNVLTAATTHTVTPNAGAHGTISPNAPQTVAAGASVSFTITPDAGYATFVGGNCSGTLTGSTQSAATYTIAALNADCTLSVSFNPIYRLVTPSAGAGGSISPSTPQSVPNGSSATFTLTASAGYAIASVTGTCHGALSGTIYTTDPVSADCSVVASFAAQTPAPVAVPAPALPFSALIGLALLLIALAMLALRLR